MNVKCAIFLSIRDKSKRFPKKVRQIIRNQTVTEHLIDRLRLAKEPDSIIMTTSSNSEDDWLVDIAGQKKISCFRGDEDDKLQRYLDAAKEFKIDFCVIVDGDDIFADWHFIDEIIKRYKLYQDDYIICDKLPLGVTGFGVKVNALEMVVKFKGEKNTEIWGQYFTETNRFKTYFIQIPKIYQRPDYRLTLDYYDDFLLFESIYKHLFKEEKQMELKEIIAFLDANPKIATLNSMAQKQYDENILKSRCLIEKDIKSWG